MSPIHQSRRILPSDPAVDAKQSACWHRKDREGHDDEGRHVRSVGPVRIPATHGAAGTTNAPPNADGRICGRVVTGRVGQAYNIVDYLGALTAELGARRPWRMPTWRLRPIPYLHTIMTTSMRVSNAKAKRELGWTPAVQTYREGVPLAATAGRTAVASRHVGQP